MLAAQSVQDFQLPPNPTPTATPDIEGPVDPESGPLPAQPRTIATPTPSPTPQESEAADTSQLGEDQPPPAEAASREVPPVRSQPRAVPERPPAPSESAEPAEPALDLPPPAIATPSPAPVREQTEDTSSPEEQGNWLWPAIGGGLLASFALGFLIARRRREIVPPQIERPQVGASPAATPANALTISVEPVKLTRSVMNATLHYRVILTNRSENALGAAELGVDMIGAHGSAPVDEQVANPAHKLELRRTFERIAPSQSVRYEGQIAIPLSQARVIRQGNAALFIPLLRVRVDGVSEEPQLKTFVIGQGAGNGGRVMPFRLDDGPREFQPIAARALD